jgi:hypothetical protein
LKAGGRYPPLNTFVRHDPKLPVILYHPAEGLIGIVIKQTRPTFARRLRQ